MNYSCSKRALGAIFLFHGWMSRIVFGSRSCYFEELYQDIDVPYESGLAEFGRAAFEFGREMERDSLIGHTPVDSMVYSRHSLTTLQGS